VNRAEIPAIAARDGQIAASLKAAAAYGLKAKGKMRREKEEARAKIPPAPHFQTSCLLSASGTRSTTLGGMTARSTRCVYRRREAECDHG